MEKQSTNYAVEFLTFKIHNVERVKEFITLDDEIWTTYLAKFPFFISKEVWTSKTNPNEVHSLIYWETLSEWKSIPVAELMAKDKEFTDQFGQGEFAMIGEWHNHNELYKVLEVRKKKV